MILINLLPHRELARQRARKMFNIAMGAAAVLGLLIGLLVYGWYQAQIGEQQSRNELLTSEIKKLEQEIKEVETLEEEIAALRARQDAVENLQADRNIPVYLLSESVRQLPAGLYLTSIKQQGLSVLFGGTAQSQERVSEFLRNLSHGSDWLKRPELVEIVAKTLKLSAREVRRVYNFTIRAQIQRASAAASAVPASGGA